MHILTRSTLETVTLRRTATSLMCLTIEVVHISCPPYVHTLRFHVTPWKCSGLRSGDRGGHL